LVVLLLLPMSFRKFQADHLFTGTEMLSSNEVLICDEYGIVQQIVSEQDAGGDVQKLKGVLAPGFINCHCHLELSHMKGLIPEKTGLIDFVFSVVTQRHLPDEEILEEIDVAEKEMIENGIVAAGDICNNLFTLQQKQKQRLQYYSFIEASGWLPSVASQRFERSRELYNALAKVSSASIVPHSPYSVSDALWQQIQPYYQSKVVSVHNQETAFEDELFLHNSGDFVRMYKMMNLDTSFYTPSGKSSLQTYFEKLSGAAHVLLVHNTFTKEDDVKFVKKERGDNSTSFCLCVNANQYIEQAMPPVEMFRKNNCHIVLGTDSLASNWSLSILDEMKTINRLFGDIPVSELLTWSTINGARALQMDNILGTFGKDKKPGVVVLENVDVTNSLSLQSAVARRLL
jgi:cytosine/adenosine deaminase-related metal-dependent hydrolase